MKSLNQVPGVWYKWAFGTIMRDNTYYFEFYMNGALMSSTSLGRFSASDAGCANGKSLGATGNAKMNSEYYHLKHLRYHTEAISQTRAAVPPSSIVSAAAWIDSSNRPCTIKFGRSFLMTDPAPGSRTGFCMKVGPVPLPFCSYHLNTSACTVATVVILNGRLPEVQTLITSADYPAESISSLSNRAGTFAVVSGLPKYVGVHQGDFSTSHAYAVRFSKTVICQNNTCTSSSEGTCVRCPYPAYKYEVSTEYGFNGKPSHAQHVGYNSHCSDSAIFCEPGTKEYDAYQRIMENA